MTIAILLCGGQFVCKGNTEIVKLLLKNERVNVNIKNDDCNTALWWAIFFERTEIVNLLLEKEGINVNIKNDDCNTALWWAIFFERTEIVNLLLEKEGINVNIKNENGETALMLAVRKRNTKIVRLLLKNGANVSSKFVVDIWSLKVNWFAEIRKILLAYAIFQEQELSINILNYLDNASQDDINDIFEEFKNILERLERDDILFNNPWKLEKYITNNPNISTPLRERLVKKLRSKLPLTLKYLSYLSIIESINKDKREEISDLPLPATLIEIIKKNQQYQN